MTQTVKIEYPDTDYTHLEIKGSRKTMTFYSADTVYGDVEISFEEGRDCETFYLEQHAIKALIEHLQKQLK